MVVTAVQAAADTVVTEEVPFLMAILDIQAAVLLAEQVLVELTKDILLADKYLLV